VDVDVKNVVRERRKVASWRKMSGLKFYFSRSLWVHPIVELFALWTVSALLLNPLPQFAFSMVKRPESNKSRSVYLLRWPSLGQSSRQSVVTAATDQRVSTRTTSSPGFRYCFDAGYQVVKKAFKEQENDGKY